MKWKPVDIVILMLAVCIAALLLSAVVYPIVTGTPMLEDRAKMVNGMATAVIAIIMAYVIDRLKNHDKEDK